MDASSNTALLAFYVIIALFFSFMCSIMEAVFLSVTPQHVALLQEKNPKLGNLLSYLKADVNKPLTAILTLNTIAHTMGAAGVGAQVMVLYGNEYLALSSVLLTIGVLFFSEIIPKTVGTHYWKQLTGYTTYLIYYLSKLMAPLTWLSEKITGPFVRHNTLTGFARDEFHAITELAVREGVFANEESQILTNLLTLKDTRIQSVMTPRTVTFSLSSQLTVEAYFHKYDDQPYSRIPIFENEKDNIVGFVMRTDLLLAQSRGNGQKRLDNYLREMDVVINKTSILVALRLMVKERAHIMMVANEYGNFLGIITLEDIFEELLGLEIMDEHDKIADMQKLALNMKRKLQEKDQ